MRFDRTLWAVVFGLTALFVILDPPASAGLSLPAAVLFWFLHIGIGMLLAVLATALLSRRLSAIARQFPLRLVLLGGILGSLIFTPLALLLDEFWPAATADTDQDDWLDAWEQHGGIWALIAEWLRLFPPYIVSWMLVNLIPVGTRHDPPDAPPAVLACAAAAADAPESPPAPALEPTPALEPVAVPDTPADDRAQPFLEALPPAIGRDLVAIQADLHYLQVRTTRGRAMVLASLSTAEQALGDRGLRVHRSHWVALAHVRRLAQTGAGMTLVLSDGSRIPVSRRRASEVRDRLGHSFVVSAEA